MDAGLTSQALTNEVLTDPGMPVTYAERKVMNCLCECIQFKIFQRYQTRFLAKFYTSYLFVFVPTVCYYTSAFYLPGFESPSTSDQYLKCGIVFLVTKGSSATLWVRLCYLRVRVGVVFLFLSQTFY